MTSDPHARYVSALASRNASAAMQEIWSARRKFTTWRRLWAAIARAQRRLGLNISGEQVAALEGATELTDEDFSRAAAHEQRLRHDVMAHVHALGDRAPAARGIIHLGATSQDINCNAELPMLRDALDLVCVKTAAVIAALAAQAERHAATPCLAFTHFQVAQPTTVGKRIATWAHDLALCLSRLERTRDEIRLRGLRGATGTQASYLALFDGDAGKADAMEAEFAATLGFPGDGVYALTGQTYPRVVDAFALSELACLASCVHKMCNDIRLLANRGEMDEPFGASQVGSSAMPYKRNPMRCERATGLCRFVMNLAHNAYDTAATQWLERTLDDSSNRRLALPEAFLAMDGALDLMHNVSAGLVVNEAVIRRAVLAEMPALASENLMMAAAALGRDRQAVHEAIRGHSLAAAARQKAEGGPTDLLDRLRTEPLLAGIDFGAELEPGRYVGAAARQVERFVREIVGQIRKRYEGRLPAPPEPSV